MSSGHNDLSDNYYITNNYYGDELAKEQIEREARIDELNKLSLHQGTTSNGTDDIQVTLDYITKRLKELESE